jgi:ankyrin repeat protein
MACIANSLDCAKVLVENGANLNMTNHDSIHGNGTVESGGRTPLHSAAVYGMHGENRRGEDKGNR